MKPVKRESAQVLKNRFAWACELANWTDLISKMTDKEKNRFHGKVLSAVLSQLAAYAGEPHSDMELCEQIIHQMANAKAVPILEWAREDLRSLFGPDCAKDFPSLGSDVRKNFRQLLSDEMWRGNVLTHVIRTCPQCHLFFVATDDRKKLCSRKCVEKAKTSRLKASPEASNRNREKHALIMWRAQHLKTKRNLPSNNQIEEWLTRYRQKRKKAGKSISTQPVAAVLQQYRGTEPKPNLSRKTQM